MVNKLSVLLNQDKFFKQLTYEGYKLAKSLFDSDVMIKKYKNIIYQR